MHFFTFGKLRNSRKPKDGSEQQRGGFDPLGLPIACPAMRGEQAEDLGLPHTLLTIASWCSNFQKAQTAPGQVQLQYRNMTTVLTREYLDARPDGWLDYAAKRIAQLGSDKCYNRSLCEELLNVLLPSKPPFYPHQFKTCAVVGNSGDLLKTKFGQEIDGHNAVFRDNEAPVNEKYAKYVGLKRDFRLVVRGAARNMITILNGSVGIKNEKGVAANSKHGAYDEVLIIKSVAHRDFNAMIKQIPNPVYLFQGIVLRRGAKGTGMKSIELALSMCDIVDIYGFTVDPGYTEWMGGFSFWEVLTILQNFVIPRRTCCISLTIAAGPMHRRTSEQQTVRGKAAKVLLQIPVPTPDILFIFPAANLVGPGRLGAYVRHLIHPSIDPAMDFYTKTKLVRETDQKVFFLQVIRIHSPMRSKRKHDWSDVPNREVINKAHAAALRLKRLQAGQTDGLGPFGNCKVWGNVAPGGSGPVSGSPDMSETRRNSNYNKWEILPFESLRREAQEHYIQMEAPRAGFSIDPAAPKEDVLLGLRNLYLKEHASRYTTKTSEIDGKSLNSLTSRDE
ncbi:Glycosyltransferase 29 (sialyltransferase) [Asimina triloba]